MTDDFMTTEDELSPTDAITINLMGATAAVKRYREQPAHRTEHRRYIIRVLRATLRIAQTLELSK